MQLVLHIGMHKTGTSAVQAFCRANQQRLRAQGIAYPTGVFKEHPGQHSELYDLAKDASADGVAAFASDIRASHVDECDTVFLSGENLCAADKELATSTVKGLLAVFDYVNVVFVVRNKPDYIYSAFNQHMRFAPYTVTFETFVQRMRYAPRDTFDSWNAVAFEQKNANFKIMNYESIRETFIASFLDEIFGGRINLEKLSEPDQQENVAMDYLTASIFNTLLKDMFGKSSGAVMQCYRQAFAGKSYRLPIEFILKQELNARYPDEGWYLPGYEDWYEDMVRVEPATEETQPDPRYLDDLIKFLDLVRKSR